MSLLSRYSWQSPQHVRTFSLFTNHMYPNLQASHGATPRDLKWTFADSSLETLSTCQALCMLLLRISEDGMAFTTSKETDFGAVAKACTTSGIFQLQYFQFKSTRHAGICRKLEQKYPISSNSGCWSCWNHVETMLLRAFKACPTASAPQGDLRLNFWISLVVTRCYAYILFETAPLHNSNVRDDEDDRDPHISIVSLSFSTVRCK